MTARGTARLLDCTLRDGGYTNHWNFAPPVARAVLATLAKAGLDYVECGFLTRHGRPGTTLFAGVESINALLPAGAATRFVAMAECGAFDFATLPPREENGLWGVRVSFDKQEQPAAFDAARLAMQKGYAVFLQPVRLSTSYMQKEWVGLVEQANRLRPYALSLVDTCGVWSPQQAEAWYHLAAGRLDGDIALGFHGHNNRQLAFACARALMEQATRPLIVDSCLAGMGKAAGNVCTELVVDMLAQEWGQTGYNFEAVLDAIDALGTAIPAPQSGGYSVPHLLCAVLQCNPRYAQYLQANGVFGAGALYAALGRLPTENRQLFDEQAACALLAD